MLLEPLKHVLWQVRLVLDAVQQRPKDATMCLYQEAGIGSHIRHILDHFLALQNGLHDGRVDYNIRNRGSVWERDAGVARVKLGQIEAFLSGLTSLEREIEVHSEIDCVATVSGSFRSNVSRELLYLINHTIHHLAYIRLLARSEGFDLPADIGLAPATASYLRQTGGTRQSDTACAR